LTNQQIRSLQTVSIGLHVPLEHTGEYACLSSPNLAQKLGALLDIRRERKAVEALRMLSVVYNATTESRPGSWTDVLAAVTQFSHLEYLEVCLNTDEHNFYSMYRPANYPPVAFRRLLRLVSLSFHITEPLHFLDGGQWEDFAKAVTRDVQLQHLLLSKTYPQFMAHHAAHLVSLRIGKLPPDQQFPSLRYLRLMSAQEEDFASQMFVQCPALDVCWYDCSWGKKLDLNLFLPAAASSRLHTLVAHSPTITRVLSPNYTLRHVYLHNPSNLCRDVALQHLLHALPNLHTCILVPHDIEKKAQGRVLTDDEKQDEYRHMAAAAGVAASTGRIQQIQCYPLYPGIRSLVLPQSEQLAPYARIYVPESFITGKKIDELAPYYERMHPMPSWSTWQAHIGKQLVDAGLSIMSPCGNCQNKRSGMFNTSRFETHPQGKTSVAATSSS
jgi:hypothetical protein